MKAKLFRKLGADFCKVRFERRALASARLLYVFQRTRTRRRRAHACLRMRNASSPGSSRRKKIAREDNSTSWLDSRKSPHLKGSADAAFFSLDGLWDYSAPHPLRHGYSYIDLRSLSLCISVLAVWILKMILDLKSLECEIVGEFNI